jgi:hypothetical protein
MTILAGAVLTSAFAATGQVTFLTYATDFGFIIGFVFVNLSLMRLRRTRPNLKRPFKIPFYPLTPVLGIVSSVLLIAFLEPITLVVGVTLFVFGLIAYYIRMVGSGGIRLAFGGMNLCVSVFTAILAVLLGTNSMQLALSSQTTTLLLATCILISLVCAAYAIVGILSRGGSEP